jgi:hypothetical protein
VAAGAFAFKLRTDGVFACPAGGYSPTAYLAYCNAGGYGDYDHGSFWLALEPDALAAARSADVLFLGSSRIQFALSAPPTDAWFAAAGARHYLLGFSHTENMTFAGPLLQRLKPQARAYVINLDNFFGERVTPPMNDLLHADDTPSRYRRKQAWQAPHRVVCGAAPALCGRGLTFFRERATGAWVLSGTDGLVATAVGESPPAEQNLAAETIERGKQFLALLPVPPECVLLTLAPSEKTPNARARATADALGLTLVAPQVADLRTIDGSHLDPPSAARWSEAFFAAAGPALRRCLAGPSAPR